MSARFKTTAVYLSGAIVGQTWMPMVDAGKLYRKDLRAVFDRFSEPASFGDALNSCLMNDGGDFRNPLFSPDTVVRIERRCVHGPGRYEVHVREIEVARLHPELVNDSSFICDFCG